MSVLHESIVKSHLGNQYQILQCLDRSCEQCTKREKGQYHCQLCKLLFPIPSKLKLHYNKVHWNHKISVQGKI